MMDLYIVRYFDFNVMSWFDLGSYPLSDVLNKVKDYVIKGYTVMIFHIDNF